jgi:hypothetical protein
MTKRQASIDPKIVREVVEQALKEHPVSGDPNFSVVRKAKVGDPIVVKDAKGKAAFLIVPLLTGDKASGYVRLENNYSVNQVSIFGASANDHKSLVDSSFFIKPPPESVESIRAKFPDMNLSNPVFSYDKSPAKWGWIINLSNKHQIGVFVGPSGWYRISNPKLDFEG